MQVILLSMETTDRIAQWENMTQADPDNSMGWLSLGTAYKDAERTEDAVVALQKAIGLDQSLSRAYQLLGQVLVGLKRNDEAGQVLATGYTTAVRQGDVMPEKAMGTLLEKIGQAIPQVDRPVDTGRPVVDASTIVDRRTGRPGPRLPDPPLRGPLGEFIFDHFTADTWHEWIGMGTKVINELKLDFSNREHQDVYEQQMMEWLGISPEDIEKSAKE